MNSAIYLKFTVLVYGVLLLSLGFDVWNAPPSQDDVTHVVPLRASHNAGASQLLPQLEHSGVLTCGDTIRRLAKDTTPLFVSETCGGVQGQELRCSKPGRQQPGGLALPS